MIHGSGLVPLALLSLILGCQCFACQFLSYVGLVLTIFAKDSIRDSIF